MSRRYGFAGSPKWVAGHVLVLATCITMILLGRWQLNVSNSKHFDLQNFGYALQWWAFTAFAIGLWLKIIRDNARHRASAQAATATTVTPAEPAPARGEPVAYRRYVMPQSSSAPDPAEDFVQADYNAYLAGLAEPGQS